MIPDPCPRCGHTTHPTHAVGRFLPNPEFRPNYPDAPTYATRAEAEDEQCRWQADAGDPRHLIHLDIDQEDA